MLSEKLTTPNWLIFGFEVNAFVRNLVIPQGVGRVSRRRGTNLLCFASCKPKEAGKLEQTNPIITG